MPNQIDLTSTSRGSSEVVYIALMLAVVVGIGGIGVTMGADITESTSQQVQETEFEVVDPVNKEVEYASKTELIPSDVEKLYVINDADQRFVLYNGTLLTADSDTDYNGTIEKGDVVMNADSAAEAPYGGTLTFVVEQPDGNTYVADEVSIPPRDSLGGSIQSSGNVNVSNSTNFADKVELETTGLNNS